MAKRVLAAAGLGALVAAVAVTSVVRRARLSATAELLPYQARASELPPPERERFAQVSAALRAAEQVRSATGQWPTSFDAPGLRWVQRRRGVYVNYLGVPAEPARLRWLVLVIEPAAAELRDPAPPEDEEHHTLADGTAVHVSSWTAPSEGAAPAAVLPFPAAEGWTQRLAR